jgi:hypothetical protein
MRLGRGLSSAVNLYIRPHRMLLLDPKAWLKLFSSFYLLIFLAILLFGHFFFLLSFCSALPFCFIILFCAGHGSEHGLWGIPDSIGHESTELRLDGGGVVWSGICGAHIAVVACRLRRYKSRASRNRRFQPHKPWYVTFGVGWYWS